MDVGMINDIMKQTFVQQSIPEFVRKVYELLETNQFPDIICWDKQGQALTQQLLPKIFNQNTMRSFVRQLNMYGFKKIRKKDNQKQLYFVHPHLKKNNLEQLVFIKRKKRGYIQKQSLDIRQSKTISQRYNIFVYGMLSKLCQVLHLPASIKQNVNLLKFIRSLLNQLTTNQQNFHSYQRLVQNIRTSQNQIYCNDLLRSYKTFKSIDPIPGFRSAFSIFQESDS